MKKRLDIQSLLENTQKQDLVLFLKTTFSHNRELTDNFLIHFASKFELEEADFHLIMDRLKRFFPNNLSNLTHRKANQIKDHLHNLVEQARDCQSREDYRQAYIIVSHILILLDQYIDRIHEKFRFDKILDQSYRLLDGIYQDSPAPELKAKMKAFLHRFITEGKAIPLNEKRNPYMILIEWENDKPIPLARKLIHYLKEKNQLHPEYRQHWVAQQVQVLLTLSLHEDLLELLIDSQGETSVYDALQQFLTGKELREDHIQELRSQYHRQQDRNVKSRIFQILQTQDNMSTFFIELALQEYFLTGDLNILTDLMEEKKVDKNELIDIISTYATNHADIEFFHVYSAYKYLGQDELLKDWLMTESDIYEILPFLDIVYPRYPKEVERKMSALIETYLQSHFGRPALNHINDILDEVSRLGHHRLIDHLVANIRCQFGHRKHFQKLMKELVQ